MPWFFSAGQGASCCSTVLSGSLPLRGCSAEDIQRWTRSPILTAPKVCGFCRPLAISFFLLTWIFSLWDTFKWNTTLLEKDAHLALRRLLQMPTRIFPVFSSNYWNHVWCFRTGSVTVGGQVYISCWWRDIVSRRDVSFRPGGGGLNRIEGKTDVVAY